MCQLLGMNCNGSAAITFSFTGFAARGGRTADHADGWGIAYYQGSGCRVFHDDEPASDSKLAAFLRDYPIKSKIVLAHVRKATQGLPGLSNCHPFIREWLGQSWVFVHNGDLKNFQPEANFHAACNHRFLPIGTTDSEKAFCWLMQELSAKFADRATPPAWDEIAPALAEITEVIARFGNFNFMLSNGEALYAHCSSTLHALERTHPFPTAKLVDCDVSMDLSALNAQGDRMVIIATEPLTDEASWRKFQTGEFSVFVGGACVYQHINKNTRAFAMPTPEESARALLAERAAERAAEAVVSSIVVAKI